jgi:Rab3 GTPase-activating protein catalytic subunit
MSLLSFHVSNVRLLKNASSILFLLYRDLSEDLITDNAVHSDLEPLEAPEWSVSVALLERPDCLLAKHLDAFLLLCSDSRTVKQLLGDMEEEAEQHVGGRVSGVLDRLSGPPVFPPSVSSSLSDLASRVRPLRSRTPTGGPLKPELLHSVLGYMFPDSGLGPPHPPYPSELAASSSGCAADVTEAAADASTASAVREDLYAGARTGAADGLLWRLATSLACCLSWGGAAGAAHLLHEVCLEVRYRWDNGRPLPGLGPDGAPDTATALLHQKLQMINCCIARRNLQQARAAAEDREKEKSNSGNNSDTDYEEFFDAEGEEEEGGRKEGRGLAPWERAEGREERVGELRLLSDEDWLYRPALQEPAPLTEDQLAEQVWY